MDLNAGCSYRNCTLPHGPTVSLVNVSIVDSPVQSHEHHWLWSVIGHPTLQVNHRIQKQCFRKMRKLLKITKIIRKT
jgi:hypothetical protein